MSERPTVYKTIPPWAYGRDGKLKSRYFSIDFGNVEATQLAPEAQEDRFGHLTNDGTAKMNDRESCPATSVIECWLRRKYTVHADERQRAMGLEYITAGVDDLAKEIARYIAAQPAPEAPAKRFDDGARGCTAK